MDFTFLVHVHVDLAEGEELPRDDVATVLSDALEDANTGNIELGEESVSVYEIGSWSVEEEPETKSISVRDGGKGESST